jgi:hypothetical protein
MNSKPFTIMTCPAERTTLYTLLMYLGVEQQMLQGNLHSPAKKTGCHGVTRVGSKPADYKLCARATLECKNLHQKDPVKKP